MSQFKAIANAYRQFLKAGATYGAALRDVAAQLKGEPCPELLRELAAVHAEHFNCTVSWSSAGKAQFFKGAEYSFEGRFDAAYKSWQRNVLVHFSAPKESFKTEADPVAKMIKAMEKLTPAQRRKVLAAFQ